MTRLTNFNRITLAVETIGEQRSVRLFRKLFCKGEMMIVFSHFILKLYVPKY